MPSNDWILITFIHPSKSFLPGLQAYQRFCTKYQIPFQVIDKDELPHTSTEIEWHFMGIDFRKERPQNRFIIHEYCSLSTPPLAFLKNLWKRYKTLTPDLRVFSNEIIQQELGFKDNIPSLIRPVGIDTEVFQPSQVEIEKKYDFIYVGTVEKSRKIHRLLDYFVSPNMQSHTLLILSKDYSTLKKKYHSNKNIIWEGPVTYTEVAQKIRQSKYAINYIPEIYPFDIQASTKLLEYSACQIPTLTTHSRWLRAFESKYGGNYYYFNDKSPYFVWSDLERYPFSFPQTAALDWEKIILSSGIMQHLYQKYPALFQQSILKDIFLS